MHSDRTLAGATPIEASPKRVPSQVKRVSPLFPTLPSGTVGTGVWVGAILVGTDGAVKAVWPQHEPTLTPPLPKFNQAIVDAIRQWRYKPLIVDGRTSPVCLVVTVDINWQ